MTPPFVPLALAWFIGLWLAEWLVLSPLVWVVLWLLSIVALIGWFLRVPLSKPYIHHNSVMALLMVIFLFGGSSRAAYARAEQQTLATYNDSGMVTLIGTIDRYPEQRDTYTTYIMAIDALRPVNSTEPVLVQGLLLVNLPPYPAYTYGDQLQLTGRLQTPTRSATFDYRAYLAIQGIHSTFRATENSLMARQQGAPFFQALNGIRAHAEETVRQLLPEPHASLLNGILLGLNGAIPDSVQEAFNATGTTHVLVISGANFSVLVAVVSNLAQKRLGKRRGIWVSLIIIALYALMVGGDPPVLRAALMGGLVLIAMATRRIPHALNILAVVVVLLTAINPAQRADVGFQLSALATLGLILFVPFFSTITNVLLAKLSLSDGVRQDLLKVLTESLLLTLAAQLITTPLIVGTFGRLSLISLLTNVLIVPVQPLIMQSGAIATLAGMLFTPIGQFFAVFPYLGLAWTLGIVEWTAGLPFASIAVGPFGAEQVWAIYALIGFGLWLMTIPQTPIAPSPFDAPTLFGLTRRMLLMWAGLVAVAIVPWWVAHQRPDGQLHLYMFDVGQGDALMIVTPEGRQVVIDGGEEPTLLLREVGEVMPFWDRSLDLVVLTHPDQDHLGGLPELLNRYEVATILDSGNTTTTNLYQAWQNALQAEGITPLPAQAGQQIEVERGVTLEILAPRGTPFGETNLNSVVLELRYGNFCALLTGDIEMESEQRLVTENALEPCQVLKIAHHGSTTSSSVDFLEKVAPTYALISAGSGNPFGHPSPQVLERLEARGVRIFRTDQQGTIHLFTDGQSLWVEKER
jgi:competence protein ComEC